ncbi:NAD(P)-binding protein [Aspergillus parasiticus]|uniref:NAD(P)-binding protein n=1 Tax=Aspergillus parasiticus TaxID=5067 RepID=A0A5N6DG03_ASPPA|nr:NAD(P)-binding protein [Aspergillus parasiticus]
MPHNILITGGSGYLGGTLLAAWANAKINDYGKLFALVRTEKQAESVKKLYGAEPVTCSLQPDDVRELLVGNHITIVLYLIDAYSSRHQVSFIRALSEIKKATGQETHFIYTTGTKQFSDMAGLLTKEPLFDTDPRLYDIQKAQRSPYDELMTSVNTNCTVVEAGEQYDVRVYLLSPCIVYGKGEGFGNRISIQTVDVVNAFKTAGYAFHIGRENQTWPVCHVHDCVSLYISLIRAILDGQNPGYGKHGYYLASSGSVCWDDIYVGVGKALKQRGIIENDTVAPIADGDLERVASALNVEPSSVVVKIGGSSLYTARHGRMLGWQPQYPPQHLLETLDEEVDWILKNLGNEHLGIR